MGREIERKFLLSSDDWRSAARGSEHLRQGYLVAERGRSVRVRIAGERAALTIKGETQGATRPEFEYAIPVEDAEAMLDGLCLRPVIEKVRHRVEHDGHVWEIDEFGGEHEGLVVAELELDAESESFARPEWIGDEVTDDPRYYNANLVRNARTPRNGG